MMDLTRSSPSEPAPRRPATWDSPDIRARMTGDGIFIDCGANAGPLPDRLLTPKSVLYAFEPNPVAFQSLKAKYGHSPQIHCINQAVGNFSGRARLFLHRQAPQDPLTYSSGSSMKEDKNNVSPDSVEVEVCRLSDFIRQLTDSTHRRIAILKLDVEGSEYDILEDLAETGVLGLIDLVLVETHDRKVPSIREKGQRVRSRLKDLGFTHIRYDWV